MQGLHFLDLLLFAMIAAFLVLRLHRVLGRRTGHQRPPEAKPREADSGDRVIQLPDRTGARAAAGAEDGPPPPPAGAGRTGAGLTQVKIADPEFDESQFLDGARAAFEMILGAFANGDKRQLKQLLAPSVLEGFTAEIDRREKAGEQLETTLVSFILADIVGARMEGRKARVTVKFMTEQVNVLRNAAGEVVEGDPATVAKITDVWTFERDTRTRDPNWLLAETRSDD
jgi:predicted lipid-binding transport protein (Tim44 family)